MKELTLSEEYLLCTMDKKGSINFMEHQAICLTAAALIELLQKGILKIEDKKVYISEELSLENSHLVKVYDFIQDAKPMKVEKITEHFNFNISDKAIKALFSDIKESLFNKGCLDEKVNKSLFGTNSVTIAKENCVDVVIQKIRAEMLENGTMDDETIALVALLDKGKILKKYFSKYEENAVKNRLKEIKENPNNILVKRMLDYFDTILVAIVCGI